MTTSRDVGIPAQQPAPEAEAAGDAVSPRTPSNVEVHRPEPAPVTGRVAAPPDDARALEAEIRRTREQLGETVQELAARVDVKSRARAKAAQVSGRMKNATVQARRNASSRAGSMRGQVSGKTVAARQKAISASAGGRDQLVNRATAVSAPVWGATPEPVRRAVTKGASGARERWVPLSLAAAALVFGYLAFRRGSTRSLDAPPNET